MVQDGRSSDALGRVVGGMLAVPVKADRKAARVEGRRGSVGSGMIGIARSATAESLSDVLAV